MEEVLDTYALPPDPLRPLVCLDEFCKQLVSEVAAPLPAAPATADKGAKPRREDAEYVREGSASGFMIAAPHLGHREVFVGESGRRTAYDYAGAIGFLCDEMFPEAEEIIIVQDNLNTHTPASLYKRFAPEKARRLAAKIRWVYTPKHGSWLNIAEAEISVLVRAALGCRIRDLETFQRNTAADSARRNSDPRPVRWHFTTADARTKLTRLYPINLDVADH
jgi:hypothetical protein